MVITRSVLKTGFLRTVFKGMSGNLSGPAPDHVEGGYNDAAFKKTVLYCLPEEAAESPEAWQGPLPTRGPA